MTRVLEPKKKRIQNAKQLANLRPPIKKGEVLNPEGARAHNPALRALKKLTIEAFREVIEMILTGTRQDLQNMIDDPATPNVKVAIAGAFQKAIEHRDYEIVERLAERLVGKIPEVINVTKQTDLRAVIASTDRTELKIALAEIEKDV